MDWLASRRDKALLEAASRIPSDILPSQDESTQGLPARSFPFLRLPSELRNLICFHAFTSTTPVIKPTYTLPGLFYTSHQLHREAIGLYYSLSSFRCLDEESTVQWLVTLPSALRELVKEVKYDTRWIIFKTPFIPVPGAEIWLLERLMARLREKGLVVGGKGPMEEGMVRVIGSGFLKLSFWGKKEDGEAGEIVWKDVEELEQENVKEEADE